MSGLASLNRYFAFDWMTGPAPGELEYLSGAPARLVTYSHGQRGPTGRRGCRTVNRDTLPNRHARQNASHE